MPTQELRPVVKWAGGKTQLLDEITSRLPEKYNNYYEPFIGGGALLFKLQPKNAHINDVNEQLVNLYRQLQSNAASVIKEVNKLDSMPCNKEFYFATRDVYNKKIESHELDAECAGLFIWINKHCFNGLYRVNAKGLFNVPFNGKESGLSIIEDNLFGIGEYLSSVEITCGDFEDACKKAKKNDFVYFDSPYVPESITASFTSYTKDGFNKEDHERLAALFSKLSNKGVYVMLSNNDVPLVHDLYRGFNIIGVDANRAINSKGNARKGKEVIITNY